MTTNFNKIYIIGQNNDDGLPLFIETDKQQVNWAELNEFISGVKPISTYKPYHFTVKKPKTLLCDYYHIVGLGAVSQRLMELTSVFDSFRKLPIFINDEAFNVLIPSDVTDCFNVEESVWVKYDAANNMMSSIAEYTFWDEKVEVNRVFTIPQYHYNYCTDLVKNELESKANLGFSFTEIYDVASGRAYCNKSELVSQQSLKIATYQSCWTHDGSVMNTIAEVYQPICVAGTWECVFKLYGLDFYEYKMYGQSSMQALTFAMQQVKFQMVQLLEKEYLMFDLLKNIAFTKQQSMELLNAVFGHGTLLDEAHEKAINLQVIQRLLDAQGTEKEQDIDMEYLRKTFNDPKIVDYIFNHRPALTAQQIYEKAMAYQVIQL